MNDSSIIVFFATLFIVVGCGEPDVKADENMGRESGNSFDNELAEELGADDYGIRQHVVAFLKEGPNREQNSTREAELESAHFDNIRRLAEEGKLVLAGPFIDQQEVRGIFVFDVRTVEETRQLTESDPAIEAGRLEVDLRHWYGSAALMQVNNIHSKISKINT